MQSIVIAGSDAAQQYQEASLPVLTGRSFRGDSRKSPCSRHAKAGGGLLLNWAGTPVESGQVGCDP